MVNIYYTICCNFYSYLLNQNFEMSKETITVNSFENPKNIQPKNFNENITNSKDSIIVNAQSFTILTFSFE